ncbi:13926_t:CDS:2, partial [Cetraspora pellucida]
LQTITLDNASANNFAIRELAKQLTFLSININVELFQNCCLAHIINLIVQDALLKLKSRDHYFPDPLSEDEWEQVSMVQDGLKEDTNILYAIACILDPSYKLEWFRYYYEQKEKLSQKETEKIVINLQT